MKNNMLNINTWPSYSIEEGKKVKEILLSNKVNYWTGNECHLFEKEYAQFVNTNFAIALSNGTIALEIALRSLDLKIGDEVIVTPRSFIASASSIVNAGLTPVFADVELDTGNISPESISKKITNRTKAIICVHINGHPCDMDSITQICKSRKIYLIEDCAQAHGAEYRGRPVGSIGDIGCFSFCQDKIITTGGEGGMVTTSNRLLWDRMWSMKDHGKDFNEMQKKSMGNEYKWIHSSLGSNYRMTEMQASIGRIQLGKVSTWNKKRTKNANLIISILKNYSKIFRVPYIDKNIKHAWYRLNIFISDLALSKGYTQSFFLEEFNKEGIPCFSGPCPEIYREKAFKKISNYKALPNANKLGKTSLVFLVHPSLSEEDLSMIVDRINKVLVRIKI